MERYLRPFLEQHLVELRQMVFLTGPRQIGKTTLAKSLLERSVPGRNYFNWDLPDHRKKLLSEIFPGKTILPKERICFDEIHKYKRWKNTLKGLFDTHEPDAHWIVTGSAALNVYRRGQDSLLGRHFTYHLLPLSVGELVANSTQIRSLDDLTKGEFDSRSKSHQEAFEDLLERGGFPEPFIHDSPRFLRQWRISRLERLLNQDLAQTENLRQMSLVENLMFLLPERVGSPLSINSLREDLEVHFVTVKHWIDLLERLFYGFRIGTYAEKRSRMLKKESKFYLWDWTEIAKPGIRFENLVAVHLLKYVLFRNEIEGEELVLNYIKDREKREIDFVLGNRRNPILGIECKSSEPHHLNSLSYFARRLGLQRLLVLTKEPGDIKRIRHRETTIDILPASTFLATLV